jgi:hypothetical protein
LSSDIILQKKLSFLATTAHFVTYAHTSTTTYITLCFGSHGKNWAEKEIKEYMNKQSPMAYFSHDQS